MTGRTRAINCTNCGAGLEVIGGGRVTTKVCGYCGASLDATEAFRVLEVFGEMPRPDSPFRLGMQGEVRGVPFTIIGTLGQREVTDGGVWFWTDHQLYSPTHGYAWLTVEDGHTLLTRKVRDWPDGTFLTAPMVERSEHRPSRGWRGRTYRYYAWSKAETFFVEGEFNWRPEKGGTSTAVALMPGGRASDMLHFVENHRSGSFDGEREVEVTTYWPEAAAAFGVDPLLPEGTHPLQPYVAPEGSGFYKRFFGAMAAAAAVIALVLLGLRPAGQRIYEGAPADLPPEMTFAVAETGQPVQIVMHQQLSNDFADYDVTLTDPSGTDLARTYRGISYYYGGSGDDAWTEGSRYARLGFDPTIAGDYVLKVRGDASQGGVAASGTSQMRITVEPGRTNGIWLWLAAGLFGLAFLWQAAGGFRHRIARWSGSDWTEEDD